MIVVLLVMAVAPGLFTNTDPRACDLNLSRQSPSSEAWFGYDIQGCDVYARTIYGAQASIVVGFASTLFVVILGVLIGMFAGFYGGVTDSILSRITDIFFGIPLVLGGILLLASFPSGPETPKWGTMGKVSVVLAILGWTSLARITRSTVIQVKQADYVNAARALGGDAKRILRLHVLPNALAPVIVYATIVLGIFISTEATLSYLGIGLQPPVISWGRHQRRCRPRAAVAAHAAVPGGIPVRHDTGVHHDGRRRPRRLRPETALRSRTWRRQRQSLRRMRPPPATSRCSTWKISRSSSAPGTASRRR